MNEALREMKRAVYRENESILGVLECIGTLDRERSYLDEGYSSLYDLLTRGLKYSEGAANRRIRAARLLARRSELRELFRARKLSLCTMSLVYGKENEEELVREITGKSKREAEKVVALRCEAPITRREVIRPVAVREVPTSNIPLVKSTATDGGSPIAESAPVKREHRVSFTIQEEVLELVKEAQVALSSKYPKRASLEELFQLGLQKILEDEKRKQKALGSRSSKGVKEGSRAISAKVRKEVLERDKYCCSYRHHNGTVCGSKWDVEFDHIIPFAKGGRSDASNVRLLCREHNMHAARKAFGTNHINQYTHRP